MANSDEQSIFSRSLLIGAGALVTCAAAVRYMSYRDESVAEHQAQGTFLDVRGHRLHVLDVGAGPCVVLLHGNGAMIEDLQSSGLIDSLADNHRVIAFDRPGFGLSDRPAGIEWTPEVEAEYLAEALKMLNVETPVVIGHSWGTLVAVNLALRAPEGIKALVLLSGYYLPTHRLDVALQTPVSLPIVGDALRHTVLPFLARISASSEFEKMFAPQPVSEAFTAAYPVGLACRPSQLKSVADDTVEMPNAAARFSSRFLELKLPVHFIAGIDDGIVSTEDQSQALHALIPGSTLQLLPGVGHMVHHAGPGRIADVVRRATAVDAAAKAPVAA